MPIKKYINTAEVAMLTGLQQDDIRNLKAHRDEYNRWKVSKESVIDYSKSSLPSAYSYLLIVFYCSFPLYLQTNIH